MKGPIPKAPGTRQRRNRTSTAATLPSPEASAGNEVPPLPERVGLNNQWHPKVVAWWSDVWTSPMSGEFLDSDVSGVLHRLAELNQDFWMASDAALRDRLSKTISQLETELGLTPIARRRLQWEIEKGEKAVENTKTRRQSRELRETAGKDPRDVLKVVG